MDKEWLKKFGGDGQQLEFLEKVHEEQTALGNTKAGEVLAFSKKGASTTLGALAQDDDDEDFFSSFALKDDSDDEVPEVPKGSMVQDAPSQSSDAPADPAEMQASETAVLQPDQLDDCPDKQPPPDPDTTPSSHELPCEPIQDSHQGIPEDLHMSEGLVTPMDIDALGGLSVNEPKGLSAPCPITRPAAHEEPQTGSQGVVHGSATTGQDDLHQPTPAEHEQDPAPMETEPTDVSESHAQAEPASNPAIGEAIVKADAAEPASHQNTTREAVTEADPGSRRPPPTPIFPCSPKPKGMPTLAQAVKGDAAEPASQQNTSREAVTEADPGVQRPPPTPILACSPKPKGMPTLAQAVKGDAAEPASQQNTSREAVTEADPGTQRPPPTPTHPSSPKPKGMPTLAEAGGETLSPISTAPAMRLASGIQMNNSVSVMTQTPGLCSEGNAKLPQNEVPYPTAPQPADLQGKQIPDATQHLSASEGNGKDSNVSVGMVDAGMHLAGPALGSTQGPTKVATSSSPSQNPSQVFVQPSQLKAAPLARIAQTVLPRPLSPHVAPVRTAVVLPKEARPTGLLPSRPTFLTAQPRSRLQHVGTTMPASVQPSKGDTSPRRRIAAPPTIPHKQPYAVGPISGPAGQLGQPQRRPSGGSSIHRIFPAQTPLPSKHDLPMRCPEVRHASPTTVLQQGSVAAMPTPVVNKQPSSTGPVNTPMAPPTNTPRAPPANTFSCHARGSDSPIIPVQPSGPPATVEATVPAPLIPRRDTSHLKPVSAQLSEETRKLNQMLLQAEQMHDEAMALRVRVAIHGNRLARLDNPILLDAFKSLKQRADEIMGREE